MKKQHTFRFEEVKTIEDKFLRKRREKLFTPEDAEQLEDNRLGIAFSGGGIRSASICLGAVKVLNQLGILKRADYISSVSGGGYTNAYVQATLQNGNGYDHLVDEEFIQHMRERGSHYMSADASKIMPAKLLTFFNVLANIIIGLLNPIILLSLFLLLWYMVYSMLFPLISPWVDDLAIASRYLGLATLACAGIGMSTYYFFRAPFRLFQWSQKATILLLALLLLSLSFVYADPWLSKLASILPAHLWQVLLLCVGLIGLGFFTNINSISFGRIYGDSLTRAFLASDTSILLKDLCNTDDDGTPALAPYPLFNCCLNVGLAASSDSLTADYFLLSPKFCGAKLAGYVQAKDTPGYRELSLARAMSTSAAAINTGMGTFSSGMASILIGLLNFRTGALLPNPRNLGRIFSKYIWWPRYYLRSLFLSNHEGDNVLDISDGGHIENLAVFELLKRRCRLIIGFDGGMDADYTFEDLKNLIRRARNELGIEIRWREGNHPFEEIGRGINGFSRKRFAIADLYLLWERKSVDGEYIVEHYQDRKVGTYVYVKSSLLAPEGVPTIDREDYLQYATYKYKTYNYDFPHHSTSDQSFEPVQFEAYYQLGQYLCADMLGIKDLSTFLQHQQLDITREQLLEVLERREQLEQIRDLAENMPLEIRTEPKGETDYLM